VGILMERSVELVVSLLAVLKAGGAYVPLDPAYPRQRLEGMIADAGVEVLLTQERLVQGSGGLPPADGVRVMCVDQEWNTIAQESEANPKPTVSADNLAYVIYTSGST